MRRPATWSAIMCNYNHAHFLAGALHALVSQSRLPCEVIVVDDGSSDDSIEVIQSIAARYPCIRLIRNERNLGVLAAASLGTKAAVGEYVYYASADDKTLPGLAEKSLALLEQYPGAGVCCSEPMIYVEDSDLVKANRQGIEAPVQLAPDQLTELLRKRRLWLAGHTAMIKRAAWQEAGGLIAALRWYSDWFAILVVGFRFGICYVPEALAVLRARSDSFSAQRPAALEVEVLRHMLDLLRSDEYRDVACCFRDSHVLAAYGFPMLRVLSTHPGGREFLSVGLFAQVMRKELRKLATQLAPTALKRLVQRIRNARQRPIYDLESIAASLRTPKLG